MKPIAQIITITLLLVLVAGCSSTSITRQTPNGVNVTMTDRYFLMKIKDKKVSDNYVDGEYLTDWNTGQAGGDTDMMNAMGSVLMMIIKQTALEAASSGAAP